MNKNVFKFTSQSHLCSFCVSHFACMSYSWFTFSIQLKLISIDNLGKVSCLTWGFLLFVCQVFLFNII